MSDGGLDIIGIGKASEKFLDVVSRGAGVLYRPIAIRNEGKAEADKLLMIEHAKAQAEEDRKAIAIAGQISRVAELTNGDPQLIERTKVRLLMQELQSQQNIEAIADEAMRQMPSNVSDEPVSSEWSQRFFKYAGDVSADDMQKLWATILTREIAQPNSFAPRTLDTLHNLTKREAETFARFLNLCFLSPFHGPLQLRSERRGAFPTYGVTFTDLMELKEAGLVATDAVNMNFEAGATIVMVFGGSTLQLEPSGARAFPFYALTRAGQDLRRVVPCQFADPYLMACMTQLAGDGVKAKVVFGSGAVRAHAATLPGWTAE